MKRRQENIGRRAFTLTELLVVIACVALLAAVLLPALAKAKAKSQRADCQNNLKQMGFDFRTWEGDHDGYPMLFLTNANGIREPLTASNVFRCCQMMSNELNNPMVLICPGDDRTQAANFATLRNTNISYFIGPDVNETFPAMWLAGDRNLVTNGVPVSPGLITIKSSDTLGWSQAMHKGAGNLILADGSVQQVSGAGVQQYSKQSGTDVMRLVVP